MAGSPELTLGIDLGTSFSTVAVRVNDRTYFVPDNRGEACIPSIVYFPSDGAPVIGAYALKKRPIEPANTISGIKRILGRDFESPEAKILRANSAVRMRKAPNGAPVIETRAGDHTAVDIASLIFSHLRSLAETRFRAKITKAVLTLPASATTEVEHATVKAAKAAGLDVLRTLTEPHAAALACGLDQRHKFRKLLVYDFGGGTFDATAIDQREGRFEPMAIGGDGCLGGDDLDHALAGLASSHVWKTTKVELSNDVERWDRLIREAEQTKRALSARDVAPLRLKRAFLAKGRDRDLELMIHRQDVEPRWTPLIQRSITVAAQTLLAAGLKPKDIGATLMVGGTTFVPMVQAALTKLMGPTVLPHASPQTSVAEGAAIAAVRALARAA